MNATPVTSITLKFTLEEAREFRTAVGALNLLYDALATDTGHIQDDESYGLDAARIEALFGLLDSAFTVLRDHGIRLSEEIDAYRTGERVASRSRIKSGEEGKQADDRA